MNSYANHQLFRRDPHLVDAIILRVHTYMILGTQIRASNSFNISLQHPDPDHSLAYVIIRTDAGDGLEGHGPTFTNGRGTEIGTHHFLRFLMSDQSYY